MINFILLAILGLIGLIDSNSGSKLANGSTNSIAVKKRNYSGWGNYPQKVDYNSAWGEIRELILQRDNFTCQLCGKQGNYELQVHHITEISLGGRNDPSNLQTICIQCHERYHGFPIGDDEKKDAKYDNYGFVFTLPKKIRIIREAINNRESLQVQYTNKNNIRSLRTIDPIKMEYGFEEKNKRCVYVQAYCHKRQEVRTFRYSRIELI